MQLQWCQKPVGYAVYFVHILKHCIFDAGNKAVRMLT